MSPPRYQTLLLLLSSEPIPKPIVGLSPFATNSREENLQAMSDMKTRRFGRLAR